MDKNTVKTYPIPIFKSNKIISLDIYPTDTKEDITKKIFYSINKDYNIFSFFEKDFSWIDFLERKKKQYFLNLFELDLFRIQNKENGSLMINFELLEELVKKFDISPNKKKYNDRVYLYYCLFYILIFSLPNIRQKIPKSLKKKKTRLPSVGKSKKPVSLKETEKTLKEPVSSKETEKTLKEPVSLKDTEKTLKEPVSSKETEKPKTIFIVPTVQKNQEYNYFEDKYKNVRQKGLEIDIYIKQFINLMNKYFLPKTFEHNLTSDIKVLESIYFLNIRETNLIKNQYNLSKDSFEFFNGIEPLSFTDTEFNGRIFTYEIETKEYNTGILFNNIQLNEYLPAAHYKKFYKFFGNRELKNKTENNDNLYIYREGENVQIFCKNIKKGILLQVLLLNNSYCNHIENCFQFLHMEESKFKIISEKPSGILGSFIFENSSFQSYLLSDLIMNDSLFQKFLLLNDTDKITRDNNSIYLYFKNITETKEEVEKIEVGGWNKDTSRFGDITATLIPLRKEKNFYISVKIHRAVNENVLFSFKNIMGRLLNFYNLKKVSVEQYFKQYITRLIPHPITEVILSSKVGTLGYENEDIFPGEYVRTCQKPRKPKLIKTKEELDKLNLSEEDIENRVMKFPKESVPYKNSTIEPVYYYCDSETDPFIGYVNIKNLSKDHPFQGKAPCCFKLPQKNKNSKIEKLIYEKVEIENEVKLPSIYKIKKNKVIEHTGQIGELSPILKDFFSFLSPTTNFFRIGISNSLIHSSLLYACDFSILYELSENYIPKPFLRDEFFKKQNLPVLSQENIYNNFKEINDYITFKSKPISISNVYSLVQFFFQLNIIVLNQNGDFILPKSNFNYRYIIYENNPILLLLEHLNPIRYEIIGYDNKMVVSPKHFLYTELLSIYKKNLEIQQENEIYSPVSFSFYNRFRTILPSPKYQILSKNGQLRILIVKKIPLYFKETLPPMDIININSIKYIPTLEEITSFLKEPNLIYKKIEFLKINTNYSIVDIDENISIPFRTNEKYINFKEIDFHPVLFYIRENRNDFLSFCSIYQIINILKDYILIEFEKFLKKEQSSIDEKEIIIEKFKKNNIEFIMKKDFKVNNISIHKNKNEWIYKNEKLCIPKELENIINYFLIWNLTYNLDEIKEWKNKNTVSFYHFSSQFDKKEDNYIQLSNTAFKNVNYQSFFIFPVDKEPLDKLFLLKEYKDDLYSLKEETLYYNFFQSKDMIQPFFILYKSNSSITGIQLNTIHSIMYYYYKYNIFTFDSREEPTSNKYEKYYKIYETNKIFMIFFYFI